MASSEIAELSFESTTTLLSIIKEPSSFLIGVAVSSPIARIKTTMFFLFAYSISVEKSFALPPSLKRSTYFSSVFVCMLETVSNMVKISVPF